MLCRCWAAQASLDVAAGSMGMGILNIQSSTMLLRGCKQVVLADSSELTLLVQYHEKKPFRHHVSPQEPFCIPLGLDV